MSIKRLVTGAFLNGFLAWGAFALSYNSYKEYAQGMDGGLSPELKILIKQTFPLSILVFMALYVLYGIGRNKDDAYPTVKHYAAIIILYAVIINHVFLSEGEGALIVINLSIVYLMALLVLWHMLKRIGVMDIQITVPLFARKYLQRSAPIEAEDLKVKPLLHNFAVYFFALFLLCALLLLLGQEKGAKGLAHIAYFLLLIWVVSGMLGLLWSGKKEG